MPYRTPVTPEDWDIWHKRNRENYRRRIERDPEGERERKHDKQRRYKARRRERERAANPEKFAAREQARIRAQEAREAQKARIQERRNQWEERYGEPYPEDRQERRRIYQREYRRTHPGQQKAEKQRYQERYPEKVREQRKRYDKNRVRVIKPENRAYINRVSKKYKQRLAEIIPAPRKGEPWTPGEDKIIMRDDITVIEMAYMLGRSYGAVSNRCVALRRPRKPVKTKLTPEQIAARKQAAYKRDYEHNRARMRAYREELKPARRTAKLWTPAEEEIAARDDITVAEICQMTERSYDAVLHRRMKLRKRQKSE